MFAFTQIANSCAMLINLWQAGFYMIHPEGWKQALEAWAADKAK